ncbi:MAG: hypothetical protein QGH20_05365 [Candidatus Latescibacteria bacterium]|nr:hypothetical protein [Candidatus Latescibacterota bacterium]
MSGRKRKWWRPSGPLFYSDRFVVWGMVVAAAALGMAFWLLPEGFWELLWAAFQEPK